MRTAAATVLVGVIVVAGVVALRETTMTVHREMPRGSRLVVEGSARTRGHRGKLASLTNALVTECAAESAARSRVRDFRLHANDDFTFALVPSLDDPDRRQLKGCLSDLSLPLLRVSVAEMQSIEP